MTRTKLLVEKNKRRQKIRGEIQAWLFVLIMFVISMLPLIAIRQQGKEVVRVDISDEGGHIYTTATGEKYYIEIKEIEE